MQSGNYENQMYTKIFKRFPAEFIYSKNFICSVKKICSFSFMIKILPFNRFFTFVTPLNNNKATSEKSYHLQKFLILYSRSFFQFHGHFNNKNKEYQGKKLVGYSAEKMFDVVADVSKYEEFLPFCKKSHVTFKSHSNIKADLVIGFPPLVESYTSNVTLMKPKLIKAVCTEGKLFDYLLTTWKFSSGLKNNENSCIIDFYVSFQFRSAFHSQLANLFFNELVRQMESAFYEEAKLRYGRPTVPMQTLKVFHKNS